MIDRILSLFGVTGIRAEWFRSDFKALAVFAWILVLAFVSCVVGAVGP